MTDSETKPNRQRWQSRPEAGSTAALRIVLWLARHTGRGFVHLILWPTSLYFLAIRGPERGASAAYLERVLGRPAKLTEVLRHIYTFAKVSVDRVYFLAGAADKIPVDFVVDPAIHEILERGEQGLFLAAHFGSFEAARVLGAELGGITMRIVLQRSVNERFMEVISEVEPEFANMIIDADQDSVALGLAIGEALSQGDWVGFLADRYRAGDRTNPQTFLNGQADFPVGPYIIANLFKAPVIGVFCRVNKRGYEIHCEVISTRTQFPRGKRAAAIDEMQAKYCARLEYHVRASPYGWFNFFDFWQGN